MTIQIAVRLPEDMVNFIDDLVRKGDAPSRAAVVSQALAHERRRRVAQRDADILAGEKADTDLVDLAAFAASTPLDDLA
jgi:Arc/MetJ-type ribon-helix-helix transcriptional regulator